MQRINSRALAVEHHALMQFRCKSRVPRTIDRDLIFLLDLVTRMSQTLGQITVVGEKKKAFGLGVEPADVEEARQMRRKQVENRVARIWSASRRNKTSALMQHDGGSAMTVDEFAG